MANQISGNYSINPGHSDIKSELADLDKQFFGPPDSDTIMSLANPNGIKKMGSMPLTEGLQEWKCEFCDKVLKISRVNHWRTCASLPPRPSSP